MDALFPIILTMILSYQKKNFTQGHLREVIKRKLAGQTSRQIANDLSIWSTRTVMKRANAESIESKSSAPISPHKTHNDYNLLCLYAMRKLLQCSVDDCVEALEGNQIIMPRSTCWYYLKSWWLTQKDKRVVHKFKEYEPWFVHIDITYWPKINGEKWYIYVAIDRATRWIYLEIHKDKKAETTAWFLKKFLDLCPFKVTKILTDNGKEFTLKNHKGKHDLTWAFDHICEAFNIEHRLTLPYHPWTNWMVERVNWTMKDNTIKVKVYENFDELSKDIKRFMYYYNIERRHWGIVKEWKWKTPYDAIIMYYEQMPDIFTCTPLEFLERIRKYCLS